MPGMFGNDKPDCVGDRVGLQASISLVRALAAVWAVSEEQVQQHLWLCKPALQTSHSDVTIGRAVLPLAAQTTNGGMLSPANANKVRQRGEFACALLACGWLFPVAVQPCCEEEDQQTPTR